MALRRVLARRKRKLCAGVWPINEAAGQPPKNWPGWPDGKKFALVLTHDVEGPEGLAKCRQLMQLEQEAGCRSSFNFIPEGDYAVSRELREELAANGFEVGVHDLHHDGKLYQSEWAFAENARRINDYLKRWNATGFRSGFMLHNLDWLRQLNVAYDASTFDTDPFEPQPDAAGTIFPFWVPRSPSAPDSGYAELPYTLPQDSTLFLVLRETSPEIWFKKLDWVASRGGMALVNVHPDYLRFGGEAASPRTFPAEFYRQLLEYARRKYGQSFWQPLPRELAEWYQRKVPHEPVEIVGGNPADVSGTIRPAQNPLRGKRAAVLLYAGIVSDARPRREMEALLNEGMSVDLICLRETPEEPAEEIRGPLRVTRISIHHDRFRKAGYFRNYGYFFLRSFAALTARSFAKRYDVVHVHNMPDALVFAALVPRLLGAKIVLDLHDPMPELYQTIYRLKQDSGMVRLLKRLEKWSIRLAHLVLTPNEAFRGIFCARGCPPAKIQIIMNSPDEEVFKPVQPAANSAVTHPPKMEFRLMYHGLIVERHGLGTAIDAVNQLSKESPDVVLDMFGEQNAYLEQILADAKKIGLDGRIRYHGMRRLDDMPAAILEADLGIIPNTRTPFTEVNFPTRIFEYLCLGKPVIVPDTKGIRDYFDDHQIIFFQPGSAEDLARAIRWVHTHPEETAAFVARGREVYERHLWSRQKERFTNAIGGLLRQ
jgi:glycosyltransferase involved in cell wall biosynthesis